MEGDLTFTVPPTPAFAIEFPGYVVNQEAAHHTLGGLQTLAAVREGKAELQLRWRPDDPLCHPLLGERKASQMLLLRVARPRSGARPSGSGSGSGSGSAAPLSAGGQQLGGGGGRVELVAAIESVYRFHGLADYQYTSCDPRAEEEQASLGGELASGPFPDQREPLLTVPPAFARVDLPLDYKYKGYINANPNVAATTVHSTASRRMYNHTDFSRVDIPPYPYPDNMPEEIPTYGIRAGDAGYKQCQDALHALLQRQPVLMPQALEEQLARPPAAAEAGTEAADGGASFRPKLLDGCRSRMCYRFRNGPWADLWVRRGYDPRSDPAARKYQAVKYCMPAEWWARVSARVKAEQDAEAAREPALPADPTLPPLATCVAQLHRFEALPRTLSVTLVLGDIEDDTIRRVLAAPEHAGACTKACGWLTPKQLTIVTAVVEGRFGALLAGRDPGDGRAGGGANGGAPLAGGADPFDVALRDGGASMMELIADAAAAGESSGGEADMEEEAGAAGDGV